MLKELWRITAKILLICYLFLVAYGTVRAGIDKVIEINKNRKKEKIISELISTKEGREKLAKTMTELAEKGGTK